MIDRHLLASIYEIRGEREKAMIIYRYILKQNPNDKKAEDNLRRIAQKKINKSGINIDMLNFFKKSQSKEELYELERWLVGN